MDLKDFGQLFETFKHSAFRLELLDRYSVPDEEEEFQLFLKGHPVSPTINKEWADLVEHAAKEGKAMARVHILPKKLTPYLRYEIEWGYAYSAAVGEDVRLIRRDEVVIPEDIQDFWLFDRRILVLMEYGKDGEFLGIKQVADPSRVQTFDALSQRLLEQAEPLTAYFARIRQNG